ncbi:MAG TPA: hypothetical protein VN611_18210 [Patescibacteria group bacterium]|nr:hypothetical protein [Patescibacteria group bacterium]
MKRLGMVITILLALVLPGIGQAEEGKTHLQNAWQVTQGLAEHSKTGPKTPLIITPSNRVHDVLAVGNDAHIYGQVEDEVVVIHGDAYIHAGAVVNDKVVAIGGQVYMEDGASAAKGVFSLGTDSVLMTSLFLAGTLMLLLGIAQLLLSIAALLLVPAAQRTGADRLRTMYWRLQETPGRVCIVGVCGLVLSFLLVILLGVSIYGIPLALLGIVILLCSAIYGMTGVALEVNRWFGNGECGEEGLTANLFRGTLLLTGAANLPIIGLFIVLGTAVLGLGSVLLLIGGKREEKG